MKFIKEHWAGILCMTGVAILVNLAPAWIQHSIGNFALGWMLGDICIKQSYVKGIK